jgi:multiple antibiotic resistance protein
MNIDFPFLHLIFVGFISLFPPVNPVGTALIMDPLLGHLDFGQRKAAAAKITFYCFCICLSTLVVGSWLFSLFGISLPIVQIAGGILICKMGWDLLSTKKDSDPEAKKAATPDRPFGGIEDILFYPMAFPMTTGAGTISVLLTLSAHGHSENTTTYVMNSLSLLTAVVLICISIYLSYAYTPYLLKRIGPSGEQILNRLSAFLVFCVGIQILTGGVTNLIQDYK